MEKSKSIIELEAYQALMQKRPRKSIRIGELAEQAGIGIQEARQRGVKGSRWNREDRELTKVKSILGIIE